MNTLLRDTAKGMAAAFFDAAGRSRRFRDDAPDLQTFVSEYWPKYVPEARKILAKMLSDTTRSEKERQDIYESLLEDQRPQTGLPNADEAFDGRRFLYDNRLVIPMDSSAKGSVH